MSFKEKFIEYNPARLEGKIVAERHEDFDMETITYIRRTRNDISVLVWDVEEGQLTGKQIEAWQKIADSGSDPFVLRSVVDSLNEVHLELLNETGPTNQL